MGVISPTLPTPGEPRGTEETDVRNALLALLAEFNGNIEASNLAESVKGLFLPVAAVVATARATADNGWLLCDGAAVARANYAGLFNAIGTAFGEGDGLSTFNLPDFRGRAPVGAGTGPGLTARPIGVKGGSETHTLTSAQSGMPAHAHGASAGNDTPDHTHYYVYQISGYQALVQGSGGVSVQAGQSDYGANTGGASARHSHSITVNNSAAPNAAQAHPIVQPYTPINWQIKT